MMKIEIKDHVLVDGVRNPLVEEATVKISFAGKTFFIKLTAHSLANMGRAMSDLEMEIDSVPLSGCLQFAFLQEHLHDQDLTFDVEHPPELIKTT